jgi:hypothetical protein
MAKHVLHLYITDLECYLKDSFNFSLHIDSEEGLEAYMEHYIPLSSIVVELPKKQEYYDLALKRLNEKETKLRASFQKELDKLDKRKQELMAIPAPTTEKKYDDPYPLG